MRLGTTQPAVSRTLQALEDDLGVCLLSRTRRKVEMTPAGMTLLRRAEAILNDLDKALVETKRVAEGSAGEIKIVYSGSFGVGMLPEAVAQLRRAHPDVRIAIMPLNTREQITALRNQRVDLALSPMPSPVEDLEIETLSAAPLWAMLPAEHHLARNTADGDSLPLAKLMREPTIILSRQSEPMIYNMYMRLCTEANVEPNIAFEVDYLDATLALIAAGLGISYAPASVRKLSHEGVVYRGVEPSLDTAVSMMWNPANLSPAARLFLDRVRGLIGSPS